MVPHLRQQQVGIKWMDGMITTTSPFANSRPVWLHHMVDVVDFAY